MVCMRLLTVVLYIGSTIAVRNSRYPCPYPGHPSCGYPANQSPNIDDYNEPEVQWCGQTYTDEYSSGRIINGVESRPHEFPWMAKLVVNDYFFCGGTLIASNYVLTAGHCVARHINGTSELPRSLRGPVKNYDLALPEEMRVELGVSEFHNDHPDVQSPVLEIVLHPLYDVFVNHDYMMQTNDIALLRIRPVQLTKFVSPICLPKLGETVPDGSMLTIAGWGLVQEESEDGSRPPLNPDVLMKTTMEKISWQQCRNNSNSRPFLEPEADLTDKHIICLLGHETDACQGDSGGAVVQRTPVGFVIQGIVSWGIGCNLENFPSAYTRVASYVNFILDNSKDGNYLPMKTWNNYLPMKPEGKYPPMNPESKYPTMKQKHTSPGGVTWWIDW